MVANRKRNHDIVIRFFDLVGNDSLIFCLIAVNPFLPTPYFVEDSAFPHFIAEEMILLEPHVPPRVSIGASQVSSLYPQLRNGRVRVAISGHSKWPSIAAPYAMLVPSISPRLDAIVVQLAFGVGLSSPRPARYSKRPSNYFVYLK